MLFQSTLPARGATPVLTLSLCDLLISIHAPREGSDLPREAGDKDDAQFQSTLPARGATYIKRLFIDRRFISIHAPREGSDLSLLIGQ